MTPPGPYKGSKKPGLNRVKNAYFLDLFYHLSPTIVRINFSGSLVLISIIQNTFLQKRSSQSRCNKLSVLQHILFLRNLSPFPLQKGNLFSNFFFSRPFVRVKKHNIIEIYICKMYIFTNMM